MTQRDTVAGYSAAAVLGFLGLLLIASFWLVIFGAGLVMGAAYLAWRTDKATSPKVRRASPAQAWAGYAVAAMLALFAAPTGFWYPPLARVMDGGAVLIALVALRAHAASARGRGEGQA